MDKLGDKGTQVRLSQGDGEVLPEVDGGKGNSDEVDDLTMPVSVLLVMVIVIDSDVDGDKYIMIQCLFVTFLFIPALLPSPLPRPELLCLDKT